MESQSHIVLRPFVPTARAAGPAGHRSRRSRALAVAGVGLLAAVAITSSGAAPAVPAYSFFTDADTRSVPTDAERNPVEVGLRFTATQPGTIVAIRFLRAHDDTATHPVRLWSEAGERLAAVDSGPGSAGAWQEVRLPTPLTVDTGDYVVSYQTTRYRVSVDFFRSPLRSGPLTAPDDAGVFTYGSGGFPGATWHSSNYWVDLVFRPDPDHPTSSIPRTALAAAPSA